MLISINNKQSLFICCILVWFTASIHAVSLEDAAKKKQGTTPTATDDLSGSDSDEDESMSQMELAQAQVKWLRNKGGFFSDKISIAPLFEPQTPHQYVPLGLFASKDFEEDETLMTIPRSCLLTTGLDDSDDLCFTALNLVEQRHLGEESEFEPYVSYVYSKDRVPLPSTFSTLGKTLLSEIRGEYLPPKDLTSLSFIKDCVDKDDSDMTENDVYEFDDEELEFAYLTIVSRAWSDKAVPVMDMINHHSGRFANVDSTSIHDEFHDSIRVFATRAIPAGEQLFLSYMDCIDERGYELEYVFPQMLRDFGFVDPYPQRWTFPPPPYDENKGQDNLVFDIDYANIHDDDEEENSHSNPQQQSPAFGEMPNMIITWLNGEPDKDQVDYLKHELKRVETLQMLLTTTIAQVQDDYERSIILEYYTSLTAALHTAIVTMQQQFDAEQEQQQQCSAEDQKAGVCTSDLAESGPTNATTANNDDSNNATDDWMACEDHWDIHETYQNVDDYFSWYQGIDVYYSRELDDACLYLDGYLHTCASTRPHYHEVFVHYAARFLDKVERVLFIGGGDSKVLHEVLKYKDLELVVGLELDQRVVRSSFRHFGTQPHFDNDKVQWYFGDAALGLLVLPRDYYGSFDLVIIDILTEVAESLKVNNELTVMEAAILMMKPGGIIVKNEDQGYVPGTNQNSTKYNLDLIYHDVPKYCLQVFVVGSNTVDFLAVPPKDHGVETIYLKGVDEFQSHFDSWYNSGGSGMQNGERCQQNDFKEIGDGESSLVGVLMILELEEISNLSKDSVKAAFKSALTMAGLEEIQALETPFGDSGYNLISLARAGYILARCNPNLRYCAVDIQLYGAAIDNLEMVKAELVAKVQSHQSSTYRFVTRGMSTLPTNNKVGPPSARELCKNETVDTTNPTKDRKEKDSADFEKPVAATLHSYNHTEAFANWHTQKPDGIQIFTQIDVPYFWIGEHVKVDLNGKWRTGTVVGYGQETYAIQFDENEPDGNGVDEVKYDGKTHPDDSNSETTIVRLEDEFDSKVVVKYLNETMGRVLGNVGIFLQLNEYEQSSLSFGIDEGMILFTSWNTGTVVATWDGLAGVTFNFYVTSPDVKLSAVISPKAKLSAVLNRVFPKTFSTLDVFPRGTGNTISFKNEIRQNGRLLWAPGQSQSTIQ